MSYEAVLENNRNWAAQMKGKDPSVFEHLAQGQAPEFLYIGCADSRVPPAALMGLAPGDVFVHRNVANLVVNTDLNAQSVIEYAIGHLHVEHVVVCGHYGCGGVKAAMQPADLGILNGWLREIRDVAHNNAAELSAIEDEDARYRRLIEINAIEQARSVLRTAVWQRRFQEAGGPTVHAWVFDLASGLVNDLAFDFEAEVAALAPTYSLG